MTVTEEPADHDALRIKDDRVRFYLDNYEAIETWAQLRTEANEELHEVFLGLVDRLSQDVLDRGYTDMDVSADDTTNARKPRIVLARVDWQNPQGRTPAAVVIEWHRPPIDKNGSLQLYVGVRVGDRGRRDARVGKHLSLLAPTLRRQLGSPWEREAESFPVWRWIAPDGDSIDEVKLAEEARRAAWACWDVCADAIGEALRG